MRSGQTILWFIFSVKLTKLPLLRDVGGDALTAATCTSSSTDANKCSFSQQAGLMVPRWQHVSVSTCALLQCLCHRCWAAAVSSPSPSVASPLPLELCYCTSSRSFTWMDETAEFCTVRANKKRGRERAKRSAPPGVRAACPVATLKWSRMKPAAGLPARLRSFLLFLHNWNDRIFSLNSSIVWQFCQSCHYASN